MFSTTNDERIRIAEFDSMWLSKQTIWKRDRFSDYVINIRTKHSEN